jgi:hypothetical protein
MTQREATYIDDNFGVWEIQSEEDIEFYNQVQRESVLKNCVICGRKVKLRPQYDKCNSCCEKIERGIDVERCSPEDYEQLTDYDDEYYEEEDEEDDGDEWEDEDEEYEDEWEDDDEGDEDDEDDEWNDE